MKAYKKILLSVLAIIVIGAVVTQAVIYNHRSEPASVIQYETSNPYITDFPLVSAHRSGGGIMPEETMMAFENCIESETFETDIFEFDLHITKDNVLVLLHDDTLDRTSDCEKVFGESNVKPENKTYEELRQLNMGAAFEDENGDTPYAEYTGDNVPDNLKILRLEDVLDYLQANGDYDYIIEIKNSGELGKQGVDILYGILSERDLLEDVIFGTFHSEVSKYVDDTYPDLMRSATIGEVLGFYFKSLVGANNLNVDYVALQIPYRLAGFNLGTAKIINYAHKHNIAVQYWTINDKEEITYLSSLKCDCIISDYPDKAYEIIKSSAD